MIADISTRTIPQLCELYPMSNQEVRAAILMRLEQTGFASKARELEQQYPAPVTTPSVPDPEPAVVATPTVTADSGLTVVDKVARYLKRFVFVRPPSLYHLLALWIIGTYLHQQFDYFGYVYFHSAKEQCGKTRMLEVLHTIAFNPAPLNVEPTPAGLFRHVDGQTHLLDELDSIANLEMLRSVLNSGFQRGGVVTRHDGDDHKKVAHKVYAPRALAGIGIGIFHRTTQDRMFTVEMVPQTAKEKRERFRLRAIQAEADQLKKEIQEWCAANAGQVVAQYNHAQFTYLDNFRDRTVDIVEPLAAINEVAYRGRTDLVDARLKLLDAVAMTRKEAECASDDYRLMLMLIQAAGNEDQLIGSASELAARIQSDDNSQLGRLGLESEISDLLRRYGFEPKSVRLNGESKRRYVVTVENLRDLLERLTPRSVVTAEVEK